ncbi:MAG: hypothetical protein JOZ48_08030, partial [Acidobacteriaceae bacterium]|nr:hypothetical protein [Acidobacteriaceae bacterium]
KIFLAYLPVYLLLLWILIAKNGVVGAALAWTLRSALELTVFATVASKLLRLNVVGLIRQGVFKAVIACATLLGLLAVVKLLYSQGLWHEGFAAAGSLVVFAWLVWYFVLDSIDRQSLTGALRRKLIV